MIDPNAFPTTEIDPPSDAADPTTTRTFGVGGDATQVVGSAPPAVPGYEIVRELGRGGMGVVYLARQPKLNREVALKMVLAGGHASEKDLARFMTEAQALAFIQHPSVTQLYEVADHDGRPYFALEYCPGGSLANKLDGTPLPAPEAAGLLARLARAVEAAHARGIVHRDLKPGNVLLAADGTPKVTDFGLARRIGADSALTATGAVLGSPSYMAPEQAASKPDAIGPGTDVYGLGAILYECLTGRPPFKAATPLETVGQVLKDEPVSPRVLQPKLPRDIETICLKCLQKDPAKRYPTAAALADDLDRFLDGRPILARPVPWWERAWKAAKRRPAVAGSGLAAVAAITAVVAVVLVKNAELERERDAARLAERAATAAKEAAEKSEAVAAAQRQKAQQRLEKAIEAVDKMMVRVASERWVGRPELQDDRRQVFEDAVAFFQSFTGEDSNDPLVRRESARAYNRIATAYVTLGEYEKAEEACRKAIALQDSLAKEFPTEFDYLAAGSETYSQLGNVYALTSKYAEGLAAYRTALDLVEKAVAARPDQPDYRLRRVEALTNLAYFFNITDPAKAREFTAEAVRVGREIGGAEDAPYTRRLTLTSAIILSGTMDLAAGRPRDAVAKYGEAEAVLAALAGVTPPTAKQADQFRQLRAVAGIQHGVAIASTPGAGRAEFQKALDKITAGIAGFDELLKIHPKSFPFRLQKFQALPVVISLTERIGDKAAWDAALAALDALEEEIVRDVPTATWIRGIGAAPRSNALVLRVRDRVPDDLDARVAKLLEPVPPGPARGNADYNAACAYAVAVGKVTGDVKERYALKAVELLNKLVADGYFAVPSRVAHLDKDADLDALRDRDDFKEFLANARAAGKKK